MVRPHGWNVEMVSKLYYAKNVRIVGLPWMSRLVQTWTSIILSDLKRSNRYLQNADSPSLNETYWFSRQRCGDVICRHNSPGVQRRLVSVALTYCQFYNSAIKWKIGKKKVEQTGGADGGVESLASVDASECRSKTDSILEVSQCRSRSVK